MSPRLCAELAAVRPVTVAEALPGCEFRRLANAEADSRHAHQEATR